jgi:hypothetical protein
MTKKKKMWTQEICELFQNLRYDSHELEKIKEGERN